MAVAAERPSKAEQERRRAAALAAGNAAAEGAAGGGVAGAQLAAKAPTAAARATAHAAIIAAIVGYLAKLRARDGGWLSRELPRKAAPGKVTTGDIARLVAEEQRRGEEFAEASLKRVTSALSTALAIPDAAQRDAAVRGILEREQRYAAQRSEAMAARAFAAIDRVAVRFDSPQGAFWRLDPGVKEHTAGCLVMGGKFWPWAVLEKVHPPRHQGCPCRLISYGEALAEGLMRAGDVPNVADAVRQASGVVMEQAQADAILEELELRDRLVDGGLVSAEALAAIPLAGVAEGAFDEAKHPRGAHGRWAKAIEMVKAASAGTSYGTGDAAVHAASTTTEHPRFFYHVSSSEHRASIAGSGLEAHRTLGGRGRTENPRVYLSAEPTDITPRFDTRPRDQYRVDTQGIALRPDPELPGQWAISAGDIPANRLELIGTTHPDGLPKATPGKFRSIGEVATAMADASLAWNARAGRSQPGAPSHAEVVKNWTKQLRGRLSKDKTAHALIAHAAAENAANPLMAKVVAAHEPDHIVVTQPQGERRVRPLIDSSNAAHRLAGTTIIPDESVHRAVSEGPAKNPAKERAETSVGYGLAAVLRHEYGHSLDDVIPKDKRKAIIAAIPDPGKDLSYYAGWHHSKGNPGEIIPELFALVTHPQYDAQVWPQSVRNAEKLLLEALGVKR